MKVEQMVLVLKIMQSKKKCNKSNSNSKGLSLECARELHNSMLFTTLMYGSEMLVLNEKEKLRRNV